MKRRRKENYGFNEFNSAKFISVFIMSISISILLLSIGFSSFSKNLIMSNAKVMVRADKDVRVSGIRVKEKTKTYANGEVVYFNVTTGIKCSESEYTETQSNTGVKSGCMKFYAFNDDGGQTLNLLLDHNTTGYVLWNSSASNVNGPKEVIEQLQEDTSSWQGTITPTNYTMDQTGQTSNAKYTIDYSSYKARLITANEVAQITGNTSWDEVITSDEFYLDSKTTTASDTCKKGNTSGCSYGWLYDNTVYADFGSDDDPSFCEEYGCTNLTKDNKNSMAFFTFGYWTSSSFASGANAGYVNRAWIIYVNGSLAPYDISLYGISGPGVRPVITVSKDKLVKEESTGGISNNEEYLDSSIYGDIILPNSDSEITYEVEVTNLGNVKVALADITNEESRLAYEIEDYILGETICDSSNNCINGVKKKFNITLKYKEGVTPTTGSIPFNLKFDFKEVYTVTYKEVTCEGCKTEALENNPFTVKIDISNPKITMKDRILTKDEYSYEEGLLTINDVDGDIVIEKGEKIYTNGEVVYFNVTTGNVCSEYTESQSNTGVKEGCMKFYAFNDSGGQTVNLLLDHNTTATIAWNSSGSSVNGPKEVLEQLKTDTSSWIGVETPDNYSMDQTGQTSNAKYTIDYSSYKARLITANEVAQITGNTSFDEKTFIGQTYYFDSNTSTASPTCYYNNDNDRGNITNCKYGWLYDRTSTSCIDWGCLNNSDQWTWGYWTSSSFARDVEAAFLISYGYSYSETGGGIFAISGRFPLDGSTVGVRPVIEVLKSKLS